MYNCCEGACYGRCVFMAFRRTCVIVVGPSCYSHGGNSHVICGCACSEDILTAISHFVFSQLSFTKVRTSFKLYCHKHM